jgi:hypothetical protein
MRGNYEMRLLVAQQNEKDRGLGFLQSAPGQVTILIAAMTVMLIFAWSYI